MEWDELLTVVWVLEGILAAFLAGIDCCVVVLSIATNRLSWVNELVWVTLSL